MRVKLSYSVDEREVLGDAAKILNLSTDQLQEAVNLFGEIQKELSSEETAVNINGCLQMILACREALYNVDMRCGEVADIIDAYDTYQKTKKTETNDSPDPTPPVSAGLDSDLEAALLGDG